MKCECGEAKIPIPERKWETVFNGNKHYESMDRIYPMLSIIRCKKCCSEWKTSNNTDIWEEHKWKQ